jgi:nitric oxide reductase NorD protein
MEQHIARGVDKAIQFIHRKRMDAWKGAGEPFMVDDSLRRFSAVASVVAGKELEAASLRGDTPPRPYWPVLYKMAHPALLPEHGFGWTDGEKLFFPVSVVEMPDIEAREALTMALLFFLSFQVRSGTLDAAFRNRSLLESDRLAADLFWIIENTRLYQEILKEYPGVLRAWPAISAYLLEKRPSARYLNKAEEKAEEFLRQMLKAAAEGQPAISASADESVRAAVELKNKWTAEGVKTRRYRAIVPFFPWGKLIPDRIKNADNPGASARAAATATPSSPGDKSPEDEKPGKTARYASRTEEVDEKANENGLTLNIYDKILSWADFVNVNRQFDDDPDEDPGKKADECEELTTASLEKSTANTFNADLEKADSRADDDGQTEDLSGEAVYYPEWDYKNRPTGLITALIEVDATGEDAGFCARVLSEKRGIIKEVTRNLEMLSPSLSLTSRQTEGTSIDLNAAVEAFADLEAGHTPEDKLYCSYTRTERDLSALFLVDLSMSTDGWAGDAKIIEHEKESLVILCEALKKLRDRYAIYGFSGKTRKGCRFFRIKGFAESYGDRVRNRIGGLIPYSYTRMGPAIRHATSILAREHSRTRLLFILSDGKPNDVDTYEGRYGIEDTRMAIKEAERAGITPFCLTVDTGAADYLPRLFGRGNYAVVPGVDMLAKKLPELYARIIHKL